MSIPGDNLRSARAILEVDQQTVARLGELLLDERAALTERDAERLGGVVQHKLECLKLLERNEVERRALLRRCATADWSRLLVSLDPSLGDSWAQLRTRLREIAELTEVNEKIVNRTRYSTARLLALLRGNITEPVAGVYDRSGRTSGYGDNRAITSA
jgi:flagellar biosynthesis/type III secretory pathway chaperone